MSRATEAYQRLMTATLTVDPSCHEDERFIGDVSNLETLARICRACPLFDLCAEYAELDRPKSGIWAAKTYRTNTKREQS